MKTDFLGMFLGKLAFRSMALFRLDAFSAFFPLSLRDGSSQPMAQPWVSGVVKICVLKGRFIGKLTAIKRFAFIKHVAIFLRPDVVR
jgi:hypothetical protein